jgi:hypothetical protein
MPEQNQHENRMDSVQTPEQVVPSARPVETGRVHPLGPLWRMVRLDSAIGGRVYAAGVLAAAVAILVVAARLHPDGSDHGSHQQLGLPPCGFLVMTGLPCPTCGMTTAFAYTIRGQVWPAIHAQAAGFVTAVVVMAAGLLALFALVSGRRPAFNWYRINPVTVVWVGCALFVAAWGAKILLYLLAGGSTG